MRRSLQLALIAAVVAAPVAPALAATKSVEVDDDYFVRQKAPHKVTVRAGTTVKWVWEDNVANPHNVTVKSGPVKFHSKTMTKGSYRKKVTRKGTYKIVCTIHAPSMAMTLVVK